MRIPNQSFIIYHIKCQNHFTTLNISLRFVFQAMDGKVHFVYKKVAMVEQFFDIIYSVHVEAAGDTQIRGRAGKHCGQKRTYRAVSVYFLSLCLWEN